MINVSDLLGRCEGGKLGSVRAWGRWLQLGALGKGLASWAKFA